MKVLKNILFYFLSFTWGILMTLIGGITILILMLIGHKPETFNSRCYIRVGNFWGGCALGCFFLTDSHTNLHIKQHECGHGIQNIVFGPLMPFIVCIPSAIRYWLQEIETWKNRIIFVLIILLVITILGSTLLILGLLLNILILNIISSIILVYDLFLIIWLLFIELPQYRYSIPEYDDAWFEGTASKWGAKFFPEDIN